MTVENSALSFVSVPALEDRLDHSRRWLWRSGHRRRQADRPGLRAGRRRRHGHSRPPSSLRSSRRSRRKTYTGLGYFDFTWDPAENPLNLDYLKLPGPARGVIVKETGLKPGVASLVHPRDVILQIDGFDIDAEGNYRDPQYKKLCLENLSSRGKWAGMNCKFKIWRDGKEMDIVYKLPKAEYTDELVPSQSFDQDPEYVLAGGFVFVPLERALPAQLGPDLAPARALPALLLRDGQGNAGTTRSASCSRRCCPTRPTSVTRACAISSSMKSTA